MKNLICRWLGHKYPAWGWWPWKRNSDGVRTAKVKCLRCGEEEEFTMSITCS